MEEATAAIAEDAVEVKQFVQKIEEMTRLPLRGSKARGDSPDFSFDVGDDQRPGPMQGVRNDHPDILSGSGGSREDGTLLARQDQVSRSELA